MSKKTIFNFYEVVKNLNNYCRESDEWATGGAQNVFITKKGI